MSEGPVTLCGVFNPDAPRLPCVLTQGHYPPFDGKQAEKLYWHQDFEGNRWPDRDPQVEVGGTLLHPEPPPAPDFDRQAYLLIAELIDEEIQRRDASPLESWWKREPERAAAIRARFVKSRDANLLAARGGE